MGKASGQTVREHIKTREERDKSQMAFCLFEVKPRTAFCDKPCWSTLMYVTMKHALPCTQAFSRPQVPLELDS